MGGVERTGVTLSDLDETLDRLTEKLDPPRIGVHSMVAMVMMASSLTAPPGGGLLNHDRGVVAPVDVGLSLARRGARAPSGGVVAGGVTLMRAALISVALLLALSDARVVAPL